MFAQVSFWDEAGACSVCVCDDDDVRIDRERFDDDAQLVQESDRK